MPDKYAINEILQRMSVLDELVENGETLSTEQREFYIRYLPVVCKYYNDQSEYWNLKASIALVD